MMNRILSKSYRIRQFQSCPTGRGYVSTRNKLLSTKTKVKDEKDLKWTERKEAPKWLRRMAPTKGGTDPPDAKASAVIGIVSIAFIYSWFIDPPKPKEI
mmetsp:Transcript_7248/g.11030  ORF Transcript_7248/g.11030 Transcript_7248/m.11030 type:complete len:99 (-) Transcript_7248:202-498(-)